MMPRKGRTRGSRRCDDDGDADGKPEARLERGLVYEDSPAGDDKKEGREKEPPRRLGKRWHRESEESASAGRENSREEEPASDDLEGSLFAWGSECWPWRRPSKADCERCDTGDRVSIVGKGTPQDCVVASRKMLTQWDDELTSCDHTRRAAEN